MELNVGMTIEQDPSANLLRIDMIGHESGSWIPVTGLFGNMDGDPDNEFTLESLEVNASANLKGPSLWRKFNSKSWCDLKPCMVY